MEPFIAALQAHGLTGVFLIGAWAVIKYYVGSDIKATKQGIKENSDAHRNLKSYVEQCEAAIEKRFLQVETDMKLNKAEQNSGLALIQTSLININNTLSQHIERELVYQDKVDKFMGYAYRKLGNGHQTEE